MPPRNQPEETPAPQPQPLPEQPEQPQPVKAPAPRPQPPQAPPRPTQQDVGRQPPGVSGIHPAVTAADIGAR